MTTGRNHSAEKRGLAGQRFLFELASACPLLTFKVDARRFPQPRAVCVPGSRERSGELHSDAAPPGSAPDRPEFAGGRAPVATSNRR